MGVDEELVHSQPLSVQDMQDLPPQAIIQNISLPRRHLGRVGWQRLASSQCGKMQATSTGHCCEIPNSGARLESRTTAQGNRLDPEGEEVK